METAIYKHFDTAAVYIIAWLLPFILVTLYRVCLTDRQVAKEGMIAGELPGLPLVLYHTYLFGLSLHALDFISALIFLWWGPGFVILALLILSKKKINWKKLALFTSVSCKINYVIIAGILWYYQCWTALFAYSVWIMHDQIKLNWFYFNADRARRVSEDYWIFRIAYPGFLSLPFFIESFPYRWYAAAIGTLLLLTWIIGLARTCTHKRFSQKPDSYTDNLRDIIYLRMQNTDAVD